MLSITKVNLCLCSKMFSINVFTRQSKKIHNFVDFFIRSNHFALHQDFLQVFLLIFLQIFQKATVLVLANFDN